MHSPTQTRPSSVLLKWIAEPKGDLEVPVGKPLQVPCIASGQPTPTIVWTKLDGEDQTRTLGSDLRFGAVNQADSGLYECRASNGVEKDLVARFRLNVLGKYSNSHSKQPSVSA